MKDEKQTEKQTNKQTAGAPEPPRPRGSWDGKIQVKLHPDGELLRITADRIKVDPDAHPAEVVQQLVAEVEWTHEQLRKRTRDLELQEQAAARNSEAMARQEQELQALRKRTADAVKVGEQCSALAAERQTRILSLRADRDRLAKELGKANTEAERWRLLHEGETTKRRRTREELQHLQGKQSRLRGQLRHLRDLLYWLGGNENMTVEQASARLVRLTGGTRKELDALQREAQRLTDTLEALGGDVTWTPEQAATRLAAYDEGRELLREAVGLAGQRTKQLQIEQRINEALTDRAANQGAQLSTVRTWIAEHAHGPIGYLVRQLSDALLWADVPKADRPIPYALGFTPGDRVRFNMEDVDVRISGVSCGEFKGTVAADPPSPTADEIMEAAQDVPDLGATLDELAAEAAKVTEDLALRFVALLDRLAPGLQEVDRG